MADTSTLTIVFRGLMIFHEDKTNKRMEIGRLPAAGHIPRILTIKNGVLASVFDLRRRKNLLEGAREWRIVVDDPDGDGISIFTDGKDFKRSDGAYNDAKDFRWIMDFEDKEFYGKDLSGEIEKKRLKPILLVPSGQFYTRLKSPKLDRTIREGGSTNIEQFGSVAAVTGCDIKVKSSGARLVAIISAQKEREVFRFVNEADTIYEITNTPPDVDLEAFDGTSMPGHDHHMDTRPRDPKPSAVPPAPRGAQNHFQFYYTMWKRAPDEPAKRYEFDLSEDPDPGPDPALCGKGRFGTSGGSLL